MNGTCLFFGILFITGGMMFAAGKLHPHLQAWQKMTEAERKQIRIIPLCRNIGAVIAVAGGIFVVCGINTGLRERGFVLMMVLWLIAAGVDLLFIEKSHRYEASAAVPAVHHRYFKKK